MRDTKFHTHTNQQVTLQFWIILIFRFLDKRWEHKRFWTEQQQAFPECNLLLISSWLEFHQRFTEDTQKYERERGITCIQYHSASSFKCTDKFKHEDRNRMRADIRSSFIFQLMFQFTYLHSISLSLFSCTRNSKAVMEIKESSVTSDAHHAPYPNHNNLHILLPPWAPHSMMTSHQNSANFMFTLMNRCS